MDACEKRVGKETRRRGREKKNKRNTRFRCFERERGCAITRNDEKRFYRLRIKSDVRTCARVANGD